MNEEQQEENELRKSRKTLYRLFKQCVELLTLKVDCNTFFFITHYFNKLCVTHHVHKFDSQIYINWNIF